MNQAIIKIKQIHKNLAKEIREYKSLRKAAVRPKDWSERRACAMSREYRARHIAYCLNRGTPYEKIESPLCDISMDYSFCDGYTKYLSERVAEYQEEYTKMYNEANVCASKQSA